MGREPVGLGDLVRGEKVRDGAGGPYRDKLRECARCARLVDKTKMRATSARPNSEECVDRKACEKRPVPLYDHNQVAEVQTYGVRFVKPCRVCGAYFAVAQFLALPKAAEPTTTAATGAQIHARICCCDNFMLRALRVGDVS